MNMNRKTLSFTVLISLIPLTVGCTLPWNKVEITHFSKEAAFRDCQRELDDALYNRSNKYNKVIRGDFSEFGLETDYENRTEGKIINGKCTEGTTKDRSVRSVVGFVKYLDYKYFLGELTSDSPKTQKMIVSWSKTYRYP